MGRMEWESWLTIGMSAAALAVAVHAELRLRRAERRERVRFEVQSVSEPGSDGWLTVTLVNRGTDKVEYPRVDPDSLTGFAVRPHTRFFVDPGGTFQFEYLPTLKRHPEEFAITWDKPGNGRQVLNLLEARRHD